MSVPNRDRNALRGTEHEASKQTRSALDTVGEQWGFPLSIDLRHNINLSQVSLPSV